MLDKSFLGRKLDEIKNYLDDLEPILLMSYTKFHSSRRDMRAAERNFQLIVDSAVDINTHLVLDRGFPPPEKNYGSFVALVKIGVLTEEEAENLAPSTGLRNKLVHEYEEINPELLYRSLKTFAQAYKEYGRLVLDYLEGK